MQKGHDTSSLLSPILRPILLIPPTLVLPHSPPSLPVRLSLASHVNVGLH